MFQQSFLWKVRSSNLYRIANLTIILGPSPPSNVRVSQNGLNSLLVTWTPSEGSNVTGYTIYYYQINGRLSGSVTAAETDTSVVITGLIAGATFSISVSANSSTLCSSISRRPDTLIGILLLRLLPLLSISLFTCSTSDHLAHIFSSLPHEVWSHCLSHLLNFRSHRCH